MQIHLHYGTAPPDKEADYTALNNLYELLGQSHVFNQKQFLIIIKQQTIMSEKLSTAIEQNAALVSEVKTLRSENADLKSQKAETDAQTETLLMQLADAKQATSPAPDATVTENSQINPTAQ